MSAGSSAAVFGKMPAHGDFVSRGLSMADRDALDAWLSASLAAAREALAAAFADRFDTALSWRCSGPGVAGAIAPSQDRAGRRFPLLLLCGAQGGAECEDLLYRAISEGWTVDRLAEAAGAPQGQVTHWAAGDGAERAGAMPPDLLAAMLA